MVSCSAAARYSFSSLPEACLALFFLTVTNNWNDLLYPLVNSVRSDSGLRTVISIFALVGSLELTVFEVASLSPCLWCWWCWCESVCVGGVGVGIGDIGCVSVGVVVLVFLVLLVLVMLALSVLMLVLLLMFVFHFTSLPLPASRRPVNTNPAPWFRFLRAVGLPSISLPTCSSALP